MASTWLNHQTSKVDPYIAMQSRTVAGPVPVPLQSTTTPTPTPRPPNSMARPVANGAPAPAGSAVPPAPQGTPGQGREDGEMFPTF